MARHKKIPVKYTITRTTGNTTTSFEMPRSLLKLMLTSTYTRYRDKVHEPFARAILIQIGEIWAESPDLRPKPK